MFENNITRNRLLASRTYHYDSLTWCVKKFRPVPRHLQLFYVCNDVWVFIVCTLTMITFASFLYYCVRFERTNNMTYIEISFCGIALALAGSYPFKARASVTRILTLTYLFGALILSTVIITFIFQIISTPYLLPYIQSFNDIMSSNFKLVGDNFAWLHLSQQTIVNIFQFSISNTEIGFLQVLTEILFFQQYPASKLEKFQVHGDLNLYLDQLSIDDYLAVAVSQEYALSKQLTEGKNAWTNIFSSVHCFENWENIQNFELKVLMKKEFRFVDELNYFIKYSLQGNLVKKWLADEEVRFKYGQTAAYIEPVGFTYLAAPYCLYALCSLLATLIFFAEKAIYRKSKQLNASKFWINADLMMNDDRLFFSEYNSQIDSK